MRLEPTPNVPTVLTSAENIGMEKHWNGVINSNTAFICLA
jgi:hypothetical protein